jgi:ribonuclease HI
MVELYCDGSVKENLFLETYGFVVFKDNYKIYSESGVLKIALSSNEAEILALAKALNWALNMRWIIFGNEKEIIIYEDSLYVLDRIKGNIKKPNKNFYEQQEVEKVIELIDTLRLSGIVVTLKHVDSGHNKAHQLAYSCGLNNDLLYNNILNNGTFYYRSVCAVLEREVEKTYSRARRLSKKLKNAKRKNREKLQRKANSAWKRARQMEVLLNKYKKKLAAMVGSVA